MLIFQIIYCLSSDHPIVCLYDQSFDYLLVRKLPKKDNDSLLFTPPGFDDPGKARTVWGESDFQHLNSTGARQSTHSPPLVAVQVATTPHKSRCVVLDNQMKLRNQVTCEANGKKDS